jgi:L-ribulose-5-phosphate 4-epimerase
MNFTDERMEIINICKIMEAMGYFLGTWGNVSMRIEDQILLTPSRVNYNEMKPEDIVVIDLEGNRLKGERTPTSEKEVHRQIYLKREDIQAIIHSHSLYATAAACSNVNIVPPLTEEMSQLLGGGIPVTERYVPAEQHYELGREAAKIIAELNAILLKNHGPVCCGRDLEEALLTCRITEKACQIFLSLNNTIRSVEIPDEYVHSERYRYLYKYGKENT